LCLLKLLLLNVASSLKQTFQKKFGFCSNAECPLTKLHSQSAIVLSQFLYQIDGKDDITDCNIQWTVDRGIPNSCSIYQILMRGLKWAMLKTVRSLGSLLFRSQFICLWQCNVFLRAFLSIFITCQAFGWRRLGYSLA